MIKSHLILRFLMLICIQTILTKSEKFGQIFSRNIVENRPKYHSLNLKESSMQRLGIFRMNKKHDDKTDELSRDHHLSHNDSKVRNQMKLNKICWGKMCMSKKEIQFILDLQNAQKKHHQIETAREKYKLNRIFQDYPKVNFF